MLYHENEKGRFKMDDFPSQQIVLPGFALRTVSAGLLVGLPVSLSVSR